MDLVLCDDESRLVLTNRIIRKRFVFPGHSTVSHFPSFSFFLSVHARVLNTKYLLPYILSLFNIKNL